MNSNSISHRLFAAAVAPGGRGEQKHSERSLPRPETRNVSDKSAPDENRVVRKPGQCSWSGWDYPVL